MCRHSKICFFNSWKELKLILKLIEKYALEKLKMDLY
jgi:hypothetical protein